MHIVVLKYRLSGPLEGKICAQPQELVEQVRAERHCAYAGRQPPSRSNLLLLQAHITILNSVSKKHGALAKRIMEQIGTTMGANLNEIEDQYAELGGGGWRACVRDGDWDGRILVQCSLEGDVTKLHQLVHGRGICLNGHLYTLEVTAPAHATLAAEVFNNRVRGGEFKRNPVPPAGEITVPPAA